MSAQAQRQRRTSAVLGELFNDTSDTIDLTLEDSDSDSDSFYDAALDDSWAEVHISSQGTADSSPPTDSNPSQSTGGIKYRGTSSASTRTSTTVASSSTPSWALFREEYECEDDDAPNRIFLPIQSHRNPRAAKIKAERADHEWTSGEEEEEEEKEARHPAVDVSKQAAAQTRVAQPAALPPPVTIAATNASSSAPAHRPVQEHFKVIDYPQPFHVVETYGRVNLFKKTASRPGVPWGTQYYLACLASFGLTTLDYVQRTGINQLRSESNLDSLCALFDPAKQSVIWDTSRPGIPVMARDITDRERQTYAELDREAKMLAASPFNGIIGPNGGEDMRSFGGRVLFEGRIMCNKLDERSRGGKGCQHRSFSVQLMPPKLGGSCRFSRRFGSQSILRLKMDTAMTKDARRFPGHPKTREIQQEIANFLNRPLSILGRLYRPFICKDDTIFYLWIKSPSADAPEQPSFDRVWDFIDHHAPLDDNAGSQLGKFIQRVQLGLSTSVPASEVDTINYTQDVLGDPDPITGKQQVMTDGAGAVSLAIAQDIARNLGYASIPSAFQGRLAGSKGVWYLDPSAQHPVPGQEPVRFIEVRDSQRKIFYKNDQPSDLSQHVIDLLGPSRTFSPSTLSKQIILVLHSNGVPISTFADMQRAELRAISDDITNWQGPNATVRLQLATVVERLCKVESMRAKRSTEAAEHRAQGMDSLSGKDAANDRGLGDDDREIFFGQDGRHLWNGKPLSKHECAYEMLLAGFHPRSCNFLADLLVEIAQQAMKKIISRFAIPVGRSAEAMVIPDPTGTLEEDEIQFRFSGDNIFDPDTKLVVQHVPEGDVLVTRHPCLLPTDIRKVRAVVRPELNMYRDVVVFSKKGQRPLASLLSGGDYDGDTIRVFWEPALVEPFENADVSYADCPATVTEAFHQSKETVAEFVAAQANKSKNAADSALIARLVAGAFDPRCAVCTA